MAFTNFLPVGNEALITKKPYVNLSKLTEGEHKFRIVARPIAGWIDWMDNKPMRFRPENKPKAPVDATKPVKPFWAVHVWDYAQDGLFIMEITQNSIRRALEMLAMNEDWGDLTSFDFKIKKEGSGKDTNYSVIPVPPKPMAEAIKQALALAPVRLEALYEGLDPWTDLEPTLSDIESFTGLTESQTAQLDSLLNQIKDKTFQKDLENHLKVTSIYNIAAQDFERALRALETRVNSNKKEKGNESRRMASVA